MKLLALEFITAGGCHDSPLPQGLAEEGEFMLRAVLRDAAALPGVRVSVPRDARLSHLPGDVEVTRIAGDPWRLWASMMAAADAAIVIAPETDGWLLRLAELAASSCPGYLGAEPAAVAIATSKHATSLRLAMQGVPAVPTVHAGEMLPAAANGWVIKPDDGVGSEDVWWAPDEASVRARCGDVRNAVVQPFLDGEPVSVSMLCDGTASRLLACNRQRQVRRGDRLQQIGVDVNAASGHAAALAAVVASVASALPGLRGYIGIDLVMTVDGPVVLEVNPRLTTAYAGLSASLGQNALGLILGACEGESWPMTTPLASVPVPVLPHG